MQYAFNERLARDLKHTFILLSAAVVLFFASGCEKVIKSTSDEIKGHAWSAAEGTVTSHLDFDGDTARLTVSSNDESTSIEGLCVIDDSRLMILGEHDEYIFEYKLAGKTMTLIFDGREKLFTADSARSTP